MNCFKPILLLFAATFLFFQSAESAQFLVKNIEIQGNQNLNDSSILSYLPIRIGETLNASQSDPIIKTLFKSGCFSHLVFLRDGNKLIVRVKEFPEISHFRITGNKEISSKKLESILKKMHLEMGSFYNPTTLVNFRQSLIRAYLNMGRNNVIIGVHLKKRPHNRVSIHLSIEEGVVTKVSAIQFALNHAFNANTLRNQFTLKERGLLTFFTHRDRYSPLQLEKDLLSLRNFYYNHGYLEFRILSRKITISPDKKNALIFLKIHEGPVYRINRYDLTAYKRDSEIYQMIQLKLGSVFSQKKVIDTISKIKDYLANKGYAFAKINVAIKMNHKRHNVFLKFNVDPKKPVYVRQINFSGNYRTSEKPLRFQLRQFEGSLYSLKKIKESNRRIANLPYFKDINVFLEPVPGLPNQVDLQYHVKETIAGRASVQAGYSYVEGFLYSANISEPNFMGTGKLASIFFKKSASSSQYNLRYTNPFYTVNGMSQDFNFYHIHTTPKKVKRDSYTTKTYGGATNYSMPIFEYEYLTFGYAYDHILIGNINRKIISPDALYFLENHSQPYDNFSATIGFINNTLDRSIFPMNGNLQNLSLSVAMPFLNSSLSFYKILYTGRWYCQLGLSQFVSYPHLTVGYANSYGNLKFLPFFENFYGGGIGTLPGYAANTLGPKNPNDSNSSLGGNFEVFGGFNFIFPNGITDKVRTSFSIDFGNIFQTGYKSRHSGNSNFPSTKYESVSFDNLRWSVGLLLSWNSPFGMISLGYAIPFNVKGASVQKFGFTFGTSL